ncbi:transposase mutator type [Actinobacteria bacterium OK006]|nr:transposase mutator type [Actinobacteria bacterium OK006]
MRSCHCHGASERGTHPADSCQRVIAYGPVEQRSAVASGSQRSDDRGRAAERCFLALPCSSSILVDEARRARGRRAGHRVGRRCGRRMLAAALEAEVDAYIAELADERDEQGRRLVVRNGHHQPRRVTTSAGSVEVSAPRVNDKRVDETTGKRSRFSSAILLPWCRKSPKSAEVLPLLSLHGLSSGDFVPATEQQLRRAVPGHGHSADGPVAGRPRRIPGPRPVPDRLRLGRRHPPAHTPGSGQGRRPGRARRVRRRHQGTGGHGRRLL